MNMQGMLKQAQNLQKQMLKTQEEINNMEFIGKSSLITVKMTGDKKMVDCKISSEELSNDDLEILQDMVVIATNDALKQIDKVTEDKMGPYTKGIPGLF